MTSDEPYEALRDRLLQENLLYEDEEFPADDSSIGTDGNYEWKRPHEICQLMDPPTQPEFIVETNIFTLEQGEIGNCWVIVACACIQKKKSIFNKVVPQDQNFTPGNYCGAFQFTIWRYGNWETIIVDDRLPTKDGKLVFAHSNIGNEFWGALLEKAYAKMFRKYSALISGNIADALTDFTGGFVELYKFHNANDDMPNMYTLLDSCLVNNGLAVATVDAPFTSNYGLINKHAYNITDIKKVNDNDGNEITLFRLRNPWGNTEWNGNWSDQSDKWNSLPEDQKQNMKLVSEEDGEFWMELSEFRQYFKMIAICNLLDTGNDVADSNIKNEWSEKIIENKWTADKSAEGHPNICYCPPIHLDRCDNDTLAVIELFQKNCIEQHKDNVPVSFHVCSSGSEDNASLDSLTLVDGMLRTSGTLVKQRSVLDKFNFSPSVSYVLIPFTDRQVPEGEYLVRVLCKST